MVVKTPKQFLQDALTNNSFSIEDTENTLRMTLDHSFSYLYRLQRNMNIYEEYFYTTRNVIDERDYGDFYMDYRERICANYPVALIPTQFREKFRVSSYYGKKIRYEDIIKDHQLFTRLPVIIIDNKVVRTFEFSVNDDFMTVYFGFNRYFLHTRKFDNNRWEYFYISHDVSVQVVDNSDFMDIATNTGMLQRNSYDGHSYNRILMSYLENFHFKYRTDGLYFAVVFFGDEPFGTQLLEVEKDSNGDLVIRYDLESMYRLNGYTGALTVRLYFYRHLHKYNSFRDNGYLDSKLVLMHEVDNKIVSDTFMLTDEDKHVLPVPIPTEDLLIFKAGPEKDPIYHSYTSLTHFPNANTSVLYPNIYNITDNASLKDRFKIYYFYIHPYELTYEYQFQFVYDALGYMWEKIELERLINIVKLGEFSLISDTNDIGHYDFDKLKMLVAAYHAKKMSEGSIISDDLVGNLYYELYAQMQPVMASLEDVKQTYVTSLDGTQDTSLVVPEFADAFSRVFDNIINHPIVDYFYDEVDYIRNYGDTIFAFQYKVEKLKSFIRDDYKALLNYVRAQNKVGIKYEFAASSIDLPSRYRTARENGNPFKEPMYMFPIQKIEPNNSISARIFIDGLMCVTFALERYEFTDIFYIPADYISEDSYIEIEVFHYYEAKTVHTFTAEKPYVELEFPPKQFIRPTITDLYFWPGTEDTLERIDKDKFDLEFISDRYNYYVDETTPIQIYYKTCGHGDMNKGPYYDYQGRCFTFEGQPDPKNGITAAEVSAMHSAGLLVEDTGYETDNHLQIVKLEDVIDFTRVVAGESVLQAEDNKGLLYSDISRVRIILKDPDLYDQPITIALSKKPMFRGNKKYRTEYPQYKTPIPNSQDAEEYTRAFKNGRLLSKNRYDFTDYFDGILGIQILEKLVRGDTIGFDITPYRNRLIYYKEEIESDIIDLRGIINKPFDPKFYELYINGRRLNRTNIYPIGPWEIKLGGLHSIYHLEIYEKDRDWEYYGVNFSNYYVVSDFIREPFVDEYIKDKLIEDIIGTPPPNDNTEEKQPWDKILDLYSVYFEIFYYMKLVPMKFVTGSKEQFNTEEIAKRYPIINDLYHVQNELGHDVLFLNPNVYYEPKRDEDPIGGITTYADTATDSDGTGDDTDETTPPEINWRVFLLGNRDTEDLDPPVDPENDYWEGD